MDTLRRLSIHWSKYEILVHLSEDNQMIPVTVRPSETIKDLRVHLVRQGISSWKKYFFYNGIQLGEYETLKGVNIRNGSVILLLNENSTR
uniref:Ubiquitin-like domain-containing protein n=1 Tax=Xenopus tropicalis TaxID=8364 RepID=A0A803JAI8_XENTR